MKILSINALQVFDSLGLPSIEVNLLIGDKFRQIKGRALVTTNLNSGKKYKELRDENSKFRGFGVSKAVMNINTFIVKALYNQDFSSLDELDTYLIKLDGKEDLSNLGSNAIYGISEAFLKAMALNNDLPLYEYISQVSTYDFKVPNPLIKIVEGEGFDIYITIASDTPLLEKIEAIDSLLYKVKEQAELKTLNDYLTFINKHRKDTQIEVFVGLSNLSPSDKELLSKYEVSGLLSDNEVDIELAYVENKNLVTLSAEREVILSNLIKKIDSAHRSGKQIVLSTSSTALEDGFLAHLATGTNTQFIKIDNFGTSESSIFLNELLRIERVLVEGNRVYL